MSFNYYTLPDLMVHPSFYSLLCDVRDLQNHFNLMDPAQLSVYTDAVASVVFEDGCVREMRVDLEPYYDHRIGTGVRPIVTSYTFEHRMPMYRVGERAPRYVIWTVDEPLPVCATVVARTDAFGLSCAVSAAIDWSRNMLITKTASVVVFDLDRTLIDDEGRTLDGAVSALEHARAVYDTMVLWSHGSPLHVDTQVAKFDKYGVLFDLVLSNARSGDESCKNLLYLYNYFTDTYFNKAVLVDDSVFNWTPEYTHCVVPTTVGSVAHLVYALDGC